VLRIRSEQFLCDQWRKLWADQLNEKYRGRVSRGKKKKESNSEESILRRRIMRTGRGEASKSFLWSGTTYS